MTGDENPFSDLKRVFGDYQSDDREGDWQAVVEQLSEGQSVSGTVVARAPFGAFIDIGVGFPACLQIILMHGMNHESYVANEWCPIASEIVATILRIDGRQISLEQVPYEEVIRKGRERLDVRS